MKANNGSGNNIERDEWETPSWIWDILKKQYGFNFDCCGNRINSKCWNYTDDFLGFNNSEDNICWMNPPFSKAYAMFRHFFKIVKRGVAIYRCDNMETKIWQEIILPNCSWVFIFNKRICYEGMKGKGSRFPSALIGYNVNPPKSLNGTLIRIY